MPHNSADNYSLTSEKNIFYYDMIAAEYNQLLDKEDFNKEVRKEMSEKFRSIVTPGLVLDFGGGTGKDLDWLTGNNYQVIFCEPSKGMREHAISYEQNILHSSRITFLDDTKTNFLEWNTQSPFLQVDAVLANFAVINCIPNIDLLFKKISSVIKPGGHVVALVLKNDFKKLLRSNFRNVLKAFLYKKPVTVQVQYKQHVQTVYLYTMKEIKKASNKYFDFRSAETMGTSGFCLIHLTGK
ncbi:MAG: class SAM-dependent methyltransferase [Chitinophagaceae bacterium]|nr:class SAM-dependent methyltransferase [Chitinophagaceae bacterium]MDB5221361.1 class SAM-dependent methyltransferase [Chitinophagaceae bacterium]